MTPAKKASLAKWRAKNKPKMRAQNKAWRAAHPEQNRAIQKKARANRSPEKRREKRLRDRYKLTIADRDALFAQHDGMCHLCRVRIAEAIDHCHATGRVRGALCLPCNTGLGLLGDTLPGILRAVSYLST